MKFSLITGFIGTLFILTGILFSELNKEIQIQYFLIGAIFILIAIIPEIIKGIYGVYDKID